MKVINSHIAGFIKDTYHLKEGVIYIFDDFIITEIHENAILEQEYLLFVYQILDIYSMGNPNYGVISNRIHNYTINASDFIEVINLATQKYATSIVTYDEANERRAHFESQFFQCGFETFTSLDSAIKWMRSPRLTAAS